MLAATAFTQISMQSMIGQLFHGIDSETLLAVPFFLLVGELMAASDVATRMIRLSQTLVGHLRGGLAQVVTVFSMFFAGISGSSVADVAVLSRTIAKDMAREGYDRAFTAALIASASTMANLIPPSIMAVVYGATGDVSIGGLFLAGVVPGVLIGVGLMIYSYIWGPVGVMKKRAPFSEVVIAARGSALPLVIPVIIMGGILSGWFTPTEAGMVAAVYILIVLIPALNPTHIRELPRDFMYAGLLYSLPLGAVARRVGVRLDGRVPARPRHRRRLHHRVRRQRRTDDHAAAGRAVRHRRRLHRRRAGDHHFHADHPQARRSRRHQPAAHGRGDHHDAGVRADHAAVRIVAAGRVEIRRRRLRQGGACDRCRSTSCFS